MKKYVPVLFCLVIATGCPSNDDTAQPDAGNNSLQADTGVMAEGYQPLVDADHPQNIISSRVQKNLQLFTESPAAGEEVYLPAAGLKMVKPTKLSVAERFSGFINQELGSSIHITTNPFSFSGMTLEIVSGAVNAPGSTILYTRENPVGSKEGVFYITKHEMNENVSCNYILAFGDDDFSWIVSGGFAASAESEVGGDILSSILNVKIAEEGRAPAGAKVGFTMNSGSLQLTDGFIDKVVYTKDGVFPTDSGTKLPVFQTSKIAVKVVGEQERRKFAARMLMPSNLFQFEIMSADNEVEIDGLPGLEFVTLGSDTLSSESAVIYTVLLFDEEDTYVMHGWFNSDSDDNYLPAFRELSNSLKRESE